MTVISMLTSSFFPGLPCNSERDWSIHFNVLHMLPSRYFMLCLLFFSFRYEMTTKAKFIFLPKEHEGGLDKDGGEAGEVSSLNQPQKRHEPTMMSVVTK